MLRRIVSPFALAALSALLAFGCGGATTSESKPTSADATQDKGADKDKDNPKGSILYTVSADEIAKEFETDHKAAEKKYDPKPPKPGAQGGAIVKIHGIVASSKKGEVTLKTEGKVKVVLLVKKDAPDGKKAATGQGTFKEFKDDTVFLEVDNPEYKQVTGDK